MVSRRRTNPTSVNAPESPYEAEDRTWIDPRSHAEVRKVTHFVETVEAARRDRLVVYVTHDQIEAMTMADRIVVMNGGTIEQVGRPLDLYDAPRNLFVAAFIGSPSMSLLAGEIVRGDAGPTFRSDGGSVLPLPDGASALQVARRIVYGIRPEHIHPGNAAATHGTTTIVVTEPTGPETQLVVKLNGDEIVAVFRDHVTGGSGDALPIRVQPDRVHLFDAATEQRLG